MDPGHIDSSTAQQQVMQKEAQLRVGLRNG
jgi:hypothetical protein